MSYTFFDVNNGNTPFGAAQIESLLNGQPIALGAVTADSFAAPAATITTAGITTANTTTENVATLNVSGLVANGVTTGIIASTTQTRAGGTALTKTLNIVATVANSGDAVTLPALTPGQSAIIYNNGANPAKVFPNGASDAIDGGAGGASVTLTNALRCMYTCTATNVIISAKLGAASS